MKRGHERAHDLAAERGDADALDAIVGLNPHGEEFAQHAGHWRRADQRFYQWQTDEIDVDVLNFHGGRARCGWETRRYTGYLLARSIKPIMDERRLHSRPLQRKNIRQMGAHECQAKT